MNRKVSYLVILVIAINCTCIAQESFKCHYKVLHSSYVITPSIFNLVGLIHMPTTLFKETMSKYKYVLTTDGKDYIANTASPSPYYTIRKTTNSLNMIFTTDDGDFAETARQQLRSKTKSVSFDKDGYEVYRLKGMWEGIQFNYIFYLKEEDGSAIVALKLQ